MAMPGYAGSLAWVRITAQVHKPLFGKPYLRSCQCWPLWSSFLQLSAILGAKHSDNLDAFAEVFLRMSGPTGTAKEFFASKAELVKDLEKDSMTFLDFVGIDIMKRATGCVGDSCTFMLAHGTVRVHPTRAEQFAWLYSVWGATAGALYPHLIRRVFEESHKAVPQERWEEARAAGVNIPPEQDRMSYEETEEAEDGLFMAYCRESRPDLYHVISTIRAESGNPCNVP
jgi:hypothetical protein